MPGTVTVPSTLKGHAAEIWRSTFLSAYSGTCADRDDKDSCAARIAWSAVKNKYKKGEGGTWVEKAGDPVVGPISSEVNAQPPMAYDMETLKPGAGTKYQRWVAAYNKALAEDCRNSDNPTECARAYANEAVGRVETDVEPVEKTAVKGRSIKRIVERGGPGSGHHGHEGRPGEVGGSLPSGASGGKPRTRRIRPEWEGLMDKLESLKGVKLGYSRKTSKYGDRIVLTQYKGDDDIMGSNFSPVMNADELSDWMRAEIEKENQGIALAEDAGPSWAGARVNNPRDAKASVAEALEAFGIPYGKLRAKNISFSDLARDSAYEVTVSDIDWQKWQELRDVHGMDMGAKIKNMVPKGVILNYKFINTDGLTIISEGREGDFPNVLRGEGNVENPLKERRDFDTAKRKKMASAGSAMSDGSFPIANCEDVTNALRSLGRTNKPRAKVIAHIRSRAKTLGCKMTPALKERMEMFEGYVKRAEYRSQLNDVDYALIENMGDQEIIRPDRFSTITWRTMPPSQKNVRAEATRRIIERNYAQAVEDAQIAGWKAKVNHGQPDEYYFIKPRDFNGSRIIVRAVLVRNQDSVDWELRQLSQFATDSLNIMLPKGVLRHNKEQLLKLPVLRGGQGSGHHGHRGRPGEIGGSLPSGASGQSASKKSRGTTVMIFKDPKDPKSFEGMGLLDEYKGTREDGLEEWTVWFGNDGPYTRLVDPDYYENWLRSNREQGEEFDRRQKEL